MKNKLRCILVMIIVLMGISLPQRVFADEGQDVFQKITAPQLLLAETKSGRILYERNIDEKVFPASITKLLTAILVVENCELDEIVTVSENAVRSVPSGYVNANLQVGEELTVEDLLYVMLIPSANDAANALAEYVGGSVDSFASMMNTKAKELGCTGSNFLNPSGLQQEEHYTTTRDLFLISREAEKNSIIKKIIGTTTYSLPSTNKYTKTARTFRTTNYLKLKNLTKFYCDYCIGGKTGYTGEAKNCVVEFAKKDGIELTAIVMGENAKVKGTKFLDAKEMFEYVFKNYEYKNVADKDGIFETINIKNATMATKQLDVLYKEDLFILKNKKDSQEIKKEVQYENLKAPVQKGKTVGKVIYQIDETSYTVDLVASKDVEESKAFKSIVIILIIVFLIFIIYQMKKSKVKYQNHGKKIRGK